METLIIHTKQGEGKTLAIPQLLAKFGTRRVVEEWDGRSALPDGALALTNAVCVSLPLGARRMTLADALSVG